MKLFLCSDKIGNKDANIKKKINEVLDNKPILYLLQYINDDKENIYENIKREFKDIKCPNIYITSTVQEFLDKEFSRYGAIFIDGEDDYKLLSELKLCGGINRIKQYLDNNGIIFGKNAGATILGQYIDIIQCANKDKKTSEYFMGLNMIDSFSIHCYSIDSSTDKINISKKCLEMLPKDKKIIGLPKEDILYYDNGKFKIIGSKPYYIWEAGNMIVFNTKRDKMKEYLEIETPDELMKFMDNNIAYGWLDKDKDMHLNNLQGFRENYKISSIEESILKGVGTCIDQTKITKFIMDKIGIENKVFCYRDCKESNNAKEEINMHCFVLYRYNGKLYHFEHSYRAKRGIHQYSSEKNALETITNFLEKKIKERLLKFLIYQKI